MDYLNVWNDGEHKWIKKQVQINIVPDTSNMLLLTLVACDIKTDVVDQAWIITRNNIVYKHFENKEINYWTLKDNIITLYFNSDAPYQLIFFSPSEAILADFRLFLIMNGHLIVSCDAQNTFLCANITDVSVSFFNCSDVSTFQVSF